MATIKFNNQLGSRSIVHRNLLVATVGDQQLIIDFAGKSIPGVCRVTDEKYEKNGKWSFTEWTVELAEGISGFAWSQDFGTGEYLSPTWGATVARMQDQANRADPAPTLTREAVERFIRSIFRKPGAKAEVDAMDAAESILRQPSDAVLADLMAAQTDLAAADAVLAEVTADVTAMAEAENARTEAAALRDRAAKAKAAMAKGASLADLKALLAG